MKGDQNVASRPHLRPLDNGTSRAEESAHTRVPQTQADDLGIESDEDFDTLAATILDGLLVVYTRGNERGVEFIDDDLAASVPRLDAGLIVITFYRGSD